MVDFIVRHGGEICLVDDYGRTPLHDACWRSMPRFDVVTLLLDRNIDLLRMTDVRGANALKYVCPDHWLQKDKYWPVRGLTRESSKVPVKDVMSTMGTSHRFESSISNNSSIPAGTPGMADSKH
jgi:hypothetical protein